MSAWVLTCAVLVGGAKDLGPALQAQVQGGVGVEESFQKT